LQWTIVARFSTDDHPRVSTAPPMESVRHDVGRTALRLPAGRFEKASVTVDAFEATNWPSIFGLNATSLTRALSETSQYPVRSKLVWEF
jgi:hypothetical protein